MGEVFAGKRSRRMFAGCGLLGLVWSAVGIVAGELWMLAVGVPVLMVGLYGLLGRRWMDPL